MRGRRPVSHRSSADTLVAVAFGLLSLALYGATAAPSVATIFDDSLEFQLVLPTLGIAHPSGYPLYTLLGKLFTTVLPLRDPAGRANLLSALAAATAVGIYYLVAVRTSRNRVAAAVVTTAFAISPVWWSQATLAEVYALHGLFVALFLYLLLRWDDAIGRGAPAAGWLAAAGLTLGAGVAHHRMIALLLPAALVLVIWSAPQLLRQPGRWVRPALLAAAPLLFYLYLPLRGQSVSSLDSSFKPTLAGTVDWILARDYRIFLTGNPFGVQRNAGFFIGLAIEQLGPLLLLAALWGLLTAWRHSLPRYGFLLLATVAQTAFAVAYKVQDVGVFFIPVVMLLGLWAALGLLPGIDGARATFAGLARRANAPTWSRPWILGAAALLIAVIFLFEPIRAAVRSLPEQDRSQAWDVYEYGEDVIANLADGAEMVGLQGEVTLGRYFRDVLGERQDVSFVAADAEADRHRAVAAAIAAGRPVYLTRDLPGAAERYSLDARGPLIQVSPKATPGSPPPGTEVGAGVVLVEGQTDLRRGRNGAMLRINVAWAARAPVREALKVSARLVDGMGTVLVPPEDREPVHFTYPTTQWVPGEVVQDVYDLKIAPRLPAGSYQVLLILYRAADGAEVGRATLEPVPFVP